MTANELKDYHHELTESATLLKNYLCSFGFTKNQKYKKDPIIPTEYWDAVKKLRVLEDKIIKCKRLIKDINRDISHEENRQIIHIIYENFPSGIIRAAKDEAVKRQNKYYKPNKKVLAEFINPNGQKTIAQSELSKQLQSVIVTLKVIRAKASSTMDEAERTMSKGEFAEFIKLMSDLNRSIPSQSEINKLIVKSTSHATPNPNA